MDKIPKIIHYVWMGHGEKSKLILKCMASWKKYLPDYKIVEWNEENFDINSVQYVKEAYENKKWAFVSDYVRLFAIYNYGGIYIDSDVEVLKPLDKFLTLPAFSGFENKENIPTGIMGGEKGSIWYKDLLDYYQGRHFINSDGTLDMITNVDTITNITVEKYGLVRNGSYQELKGQVFMFPPEYFCPINPENGTKRITENTYTIHHFNGSWCDPHERFKKKLQIILDDRIVRFIVKIKRIFK